MVDVSKYQGEIDWHGVKEAGVDFAIIRLGFRGYGEEGNLVLDEYFVKNIENAQKEGLLTGVYFFSQAVNETESEEEALFILQNLDGNKIDGPVVFDTEEIQEDGARTQSVSGEMFTKNCVAFCKKIQDADYEEIPQCPYAFSNWQYTESGSVPGIQGNVDLNIWFQKP